MSLNTAHASNGVLIHTGEYILLYSDSVSINFMGHDNEVFKGSKEGRIYLTTHRMIFNAKNHNEILQSFSFPFVALQDVDLEQPVFGANYIKGKVRAQPNGNWSGEVKFKLYFNVGGAIDFGTALLRAAGTARHNTHVHDSPPPYTPPSGSWYEAPPPAYQAPPEYYGWLPRNEAIATRPSPNTVYMSENPPPYPGIGSGYNELCSMEPIEQMYLKASTHETEGLPFASQEHSGFPSYSQSGHHGTEQRQQSPRNSSSVISATSISPGISQQQGHEYLPHSSSATSHRNLALQIGFIETHGLPSAPNLDTARNEALDITPKSS